MWKTKMLVADDSSQTQELFSDLFLDKGFDVFQACNGIEAKQLFDSNCPEIILLDIMMPGQNGLEVLKYIKEKSPHTLVIMMTAHGSEETAVEAMKLGADDYMVKPLVYKDVLHNVEQLLEKNRTRLENIRLKEKIHRTEAYLAHLIENVNEAIISTDLEGGIQSFNKAAERLWQKKESEIQKKPLSALFKTEEKGYIDNVLELTLKKGSYSGEFLFLKSDGTEFPGYLSTSVAEDSKGGKEGIVAIIRDLTSEKRLREQLIESAKLASLGKVVEGIAHEIRNPLLSMGGFARRLGKELKDNKEQSRYLDVIIDDVERLEGMVRDIEGYVNFSKSHKINFRPIEIQGIIIDILDALNLEGKNIKVALEEADLPVIYADKDSMKNLFLSIFSNAIEAMPEGGNLDISFTIDDNSVTIIVTDTGYGISEEQLGDIYDPFFTSKMTGTGMGLTKAYMIVEEHHGHLSVESEAGEGTTVSIRLLTEKRQPARILH